MTVSMKTYTSSRDLRLTRHGRGIWDSTLALSILWRHSGRKTRTARSCTVTGNTRQGGEAPKNMLKRWWNQKPCSPFAGEVLRQRGSGDKNLEMVVCL